ncbi:hypothetical protein MMC24_004398 [Lignoscripta atroalba]|nr:hypothetical protein [Lignoscripta atroalba]
MSSRQTQGQVDSSRQASGAWGMNQKGGSAEPLLPGASTWRSAEEAPSRSLEANQQVNAEKYLYRERQLAALDDECEKLQEIICFQKKQHRVINELEPRLATLSTSEASIPRRDPADPSDAEDITQPKASGSATRPSPREALTRRPFRFKPVTAERAEFIPGAQRWTNDRRTRLERARDNQVERERQQSDNLRRSPLPHRVECCRRLRRFRLVKEVLGRENGWLFLVRR